MYTFAGKIATISSQKQSSCTCIFLVKKVSPLKVKIMPVNILASNPLTLSSLGGGPISPPPSGFLSVDFYQVYLQH